MARAPKVCDSKPKLKLYAPPQGDGLIDCLVNGFVGDIVRGGVGTLTMEEIRNVSGFFDDFVVYCRHKTEGVVTTKNKKVIPIVSKD